MIFVISVFQFNLAAGSDSARRRPQVEVTKESIHEIGAKISDIDGKRRYGSRSGIGFGG